MILVPLLLALASSPRPALLAAHRGGVEFGPENTLEAMRGTLENVPECRVMEFDVQLSADGVPYLMHDPTVDRTTNGTGPLSALTSAQVDALVVDAGVNAGVRVPRLFDVLRLVREHPGVAVWCESKTAVATTIPAIARAVRESGFPPQRFFGQWNGPYPNWAQHLPEFAGVVMVSSTLPRQFTTAQLQELRTLHRVDTVITWGNGTGHTAADAAAMEAAGLRGGPISGTAATVNTTLDAGTQVFLTDWPAACRTAYLAHHWAEWKAAHGVDSTVTKSTAARPAPHTTSLLAEYSGTSAPSWQQDLRVRFPLNPWPLRVARTRAEWSADMTAWEPCPAEWLEVPLDAHAVEIHPPRGVARLFLRMVVEP